MDVINLTLPLFGLIFLGWIAARFNKLPEQGLAWMQFYIIYVALPALFFQLLRQTPIEQLSNLSFIAATTGATLIVFLLAYGFGRFGQKNSTETSTIQGIAAAYANVGYMGPALTLSALGEAAVVPTALIFCFDNALLFTLAPLFMALSATGKNHLGSVLFNVIVKKVLLHPFILATIAGILAASVKLQLPVAIEQILDSLKNTAAPCALFTMGVVIANQKASIKSLDVGVILVLKMLIHPLLVYLLLLSLGINDPVWIQTGILMAALPPALNVFVLAQQYNVYVNRASSIVLLGTLIASVTVTLLLYLLRT